MKNKDDSTIVLALLWHNIPCLLEIILTLVIIAAVNTQEIINLKKVFSLLKFLIV